MLNPALVLQQKNYIDYSSIFEILLLTFVRDNAEQQNMQKMKSASVNRPVALWLLSGCAIIYLMVVVGCITRLTHSGLSMTDWSITGGLPPLNDTEWNQEFAKYAQSPEYKKINYFITVEEFKSIYFWEWLHRFIGRALLSGTFLIGFVWFLLRKKIQGKLLWKTSFLFALGAAQGLIGWWMVKSGLVDNPAVSHYRLAIHLMSAFTCFAFTFWFALQLLLPPPVEISSQNLTGQKKLFPMALGVFAAVVLQIIFGAFVAGKKAGLGFATWPKMNDEWFPSDSILIYPTWLQSLFETPAGLQWVHRTFAFVVTVLVAALWIFSNRLALPKGVVRGVSLLIYGITIQFILGVWTLLYQVPVVLGALHQTGAFFLFVSCLYLLYQLNRIPGNEKTIETA